MEPIAKPAARDGYKTRYDGAEMPISLISDLELAEDNLVVELVEKAKVLSNFLAQFKSGAFNDVQALIELAHEKHSATLGGKKGNITLYSYDQRYIVKRQIKDRKAFDVQLQAARALVEACAARWTEGARPEAKVIVDDAFQVDREGNISVDRVLGLLRLKIDDPEWQAAMKAIAEAYRTVGSSTYLQLFERGDSNGEWRAIPLALSDVRVE